MTNGNINAATNYGGFMPGHMAAYEANIAQEFGRNYQAKPTSTYKRDSLGASSSTYRPNVLGKTSGTTDYMAEFMKGLGIGMGAAYASKMQGAPKGGMYGGCTCGNCPVHKGGAIAPGGLEKLFGAGSDYRQPYGAKKTNAKPGKYDAGDSQSNAYKA